MVKATHANVTESINECPEYVHDGSPPDLDGPYNWTSKEQGWIVSFYFAGYLIGMFPSGYFADR